MTSDVFTPAFAVLGVMTALLLAALELMWLKPSRRWIPILILGSVNALFIFLLFTSRNSYLWLLIFPIPVMPIAYLGLKWLAYRWVRRLSKSPLRAPAKLLFLSLIVHFVLCSFLFTEFDRVNPTQSHLEDAIREKQNGLLDAMLWASVVIEPNMRGLVDTAIAYENDDAVRRLIRRGADPRQPYMTWKGTHDIQWRIAKWRLDKGVSSEEFAPSIAEAAVGGGLPELDYALQKGFDPKQYPGILRAALKGPLPLEPKINRLLARGADVNGYSEGVTCLYSVILAENDLSSVMTLLIEKGADVNARTGSEVYLQSSGVSLTKGMTPLMLAARTNQAAYIAILLDYGAIRSTKDATGLTALDYAKGARAQPALRLLQKY